MQLQLLLFLLTQWTSVEASTRVVATVGMAGSALAALFGVVLSWMMDQPADADDAHRDAHSGHCAGTGLRSKLRASADQRRRCPRAGYRNILGKSSDLDQ